MDDVDHKCGIAAVFIKESSPERDNALFYLYRMLLNLQNRGQLSAGVTTFNKNRGQLLDTHKDHGSVNEVFSTNDPEKSYQIFKRYAGSKGIGHTRYATSGSNERSQAHPFERHHGRMWKWFSFGFNGNIANYAKLKEELLKKKDYHLVLNSDTEIIMHFLSRELAGDKKPNMVKVFGDLAKKLDGAYNLVFINAYGDMIIARDPTGNKPLVYGEKNGVFLAASESNALLNCGIDEIKFLEPGHMIMIEGEKVRIEKFAEAKRRARCMFEWVYFSNVTSVFDGKSVYITRNNLGKELAKGEKEKIDENCIVVSVPDTAKPVGDAFAYELKIPSQEGLIRNRYVGRTFIEATGRESKVKNKYTAIKEILKGKKVFLVDDSIVRGTTTKQLIKYVKEYGEAKEVHVRVSCPPVRSPCYYGIDMSTVSELIVPKYELTYQGRDISEDTLKKLAAEIGADSIRYLSIPHLVTSIGFSEKELCMACLNNSYPTPEGQRLFTKAIENFKKGIKEEERGYQC